MDDLEGGRLIIITPPRRPFLLLAIPRVVLHRMFGIFAPPWRIDWEETAEEIVARFLTALLIGAALCVPLFAFVFWPGKRMRSGSRPPRSYYEILGSPHWIGWVFVATALGPGLFQALTTRAVVLDPTDEVGGSEVENLDDDDEQDR